MKPDIRSLTLNDLDGLVTLREVCFPDGKDIDELEMRYRLERQLPFATGVFDEGRLVSAAVMFPFEMYLGGKRVKVGGLAAVQSAPQTRRRGYVRALLHHLLEALKASGVGFCLEYPFDPRYYARYGWQSVMSGVKVSFPTERLLSKRQPEAERLEAAEAPERLMPIYERWAQGYNAPLSRDDASMRGFEHVIQRPFEKRPRPVYLLDEAYAVITLEHSHEGLQLQVADYAYGSPSGRKDLFAFLGLFSGQAATTSMHLPAMDPLAFDLQAYLRPNPSILQCRIVDVRHALEALSPGHEARFSVRVQDDFCSWNNQTQHLELAEGQLRTKPWGQSPEVEVDIRVLSALVLGGMSPEMALQTGLLSGSLEHVRALASLSGGRQPFMPQADYF
jgi:predicted acetyltransferase